MIRLGTRLTLAGGREALARFLATASAVGIGVGLLLIVLAGFNAVDAQSQRAAWLESSSATAPMSIATQHQPLWWIFTTEQYQSETIYRVDVAATGPHSPRPPGIPYIPAAGQYFVSPALASLIHSVPATELGDRFAGKEAGILGPSAVPSPGSLIVHELLDSFTSWSVYDPILTLLKEHFSTVSTDEKSFWFCECAFHTRMWLWVDSEPVARRQDLFDYFHRFELFSAHWGSALRSDIANGFFQYNRRLSPT